MSGEVAYSLDLPRPDDAAALARVHVQAWREAYGEILPPAFYDDAALESRTAMWQRFTARPPEDLQDRVRIARDADGAVKVDPDLDDLREIRMAR